MKVFFQRLLFIIGLFLFSLTLAISLLVLFRPFYYWHIELLNLPQLSGISGEVIKANYDVLMNYLSNPFNTQLVMPDFPSSESGLFHFWEVKRLFILSFVILIISSIMTPLIYNRLRFTVPKQLILSDIRKIILVPIIIISALLIDFNWFFVKFHELIFRNEDWIFNTVTDPIINVLPETFFLNCFIAAILIMAMVIGATYRAVKNRQYSGT